MISYFYSVFAVMVLVLGGCKRSGDVDMTRKCAGIWTMDTSNQDGSEFKTTMKVSDDGHYVQHTTGHSPDGQSVSSDLEGMLQAKNGLLTVVTTKHSSPNAPVPMTNQARIVSLTDSELRILPESPKGVSVSSNEVKVFRRTR